MKNRRIYSLDVIKLFLAYGIAFFHSRMEFPPGPTVIVQVFFIISGFFLGRKYYTRSYDGGEYSAWDYTRDHVKAIYPHYLLSMAVLFLYIVARQAVEVLRNPGWTAVEEMLRTVYNQIPDIFLMQSSFRFHESLNYPAWQISALLISGYFVYTLLCRNEKTARTLIFPAAILMVMSLLNTGVDLWDNLGFFYIPLLRAFYPMCVGVLTFYVTRTEYYERLKAHRAAFDIFAILGFIALITWADLGNIFVITVPILILNCWDESSAVNRVLDRKIFACCGDLSYAIFLNHALIARIFWALLVPRLEASGVPFPTPAKAIVYFVMVTGYSLLTMTLVNRWKARKNK